MTLMVKSTISNTGINATPAGDANRTTAAVHTVRLTATTIMTYGIDQERKLLLFAIVVEMIINRQFALGTQLEENALNNNFIIATTASQMAM